VEISQTLGNPEDYPGVSQASILASDCRRYRCEGLDEERRERFWKDHVFLGQSQPEAEECARKHDDDDDDNPPPNSSRKTPQEVVHSVLHMLITDILT
jgi:hypothetical protein